MDYWDTFAKSVTSRLKSTGYLSAITASSVYDFVNYIRSVILHLPVWWSKYLAYLRKVSRRLYNRTNKTKHCTEWEAYKATFHNYNSEIKKAKWKSWVWFTASVEYVNDAFAQFLQSILNTLEASIGWMVPGLTPFKRFPICTQALVFQTAQMREPIDSSISVIGTVQHVHVILIDRIVSIPKIMWAIDNLKLFKSPGPDGIIQGMLQHASNISIMENIFEVLHLSHIALLWG